MENNKEKKLTEKELKQVTGGEIVQEWEYGPDDDWCRYSCGKFEFRSFEDLNVPMCPENCAKANWDGTCRFYRG